MGVIANTSPHCLAAFASYCGDELNDACFASSMGGSQTGWVNTAWYALARSLESASGGHVRLLINYYLIAQRLAPSAVAVKAAASL